MAVNEYPIEMIPTDYKHDWREGDRVLVCFQEPVQYVPGANKLQDTMKTKMDKTNLTMTQAWKVGTVTRGKGEGMEKLYHVKLDKGYRSIRNTSIFYQRGWVHKSRLQPYIEWM